MSVNEILSASTTSILASPGTAGLEDGQRRKHAYAVRGLESEGWATYNVRAGTGCWGWALNLEDATVFSSQADAHLAAQTYFPCQRTEVVRVNLPLRSPRVPRQARECSEGLLDFSRN
jgi:hypothetical protein